MPISLPYHKLKLCIHMLLMHIFPAVGSLQMRFVSEETKCCVFEIAWPVNFKVSADMIDLSSLCYETNLLYTYRVCQCHITSLD